MIRYQPLLARSAGLLLALQAPARAQQDPLAEPPIPPDAVGVAYHTLHGREAQVTFTSAAPLESVVGKTNEVVGYAVAGPADHPADLVAADWLLPVHTLATGIPLRDKHLAGTEWLDADHFPQIEFRLTGTEDATLVKSGDGFSTWSVTLIGQMTVHGISREIHVKDTRISFLKASDKTAAIAPGDLAFLKSVYSVKLSDFGIANGDVPNKVSDTIEISQMLRLTTQPPPAEPRPDPSR